jgi:hypothetical protein
MKKLYPFFALLFVNTLVLAIPTPPAVISDDGASHHHTQIKAL